MEPKAGPDAAPPRFIYGTAWKKDRTAALVEEAVGAGFRAIDTANQLIHYDEAEVGKALMALSGRGFKRGDLFLQTKFTPAGGQDHRTPYDRSAPVGRQVEQSFESSLAHLHTDYLDSYVLHGPYTRQGLSEADREVWRAIEGLKASGRAKQIGISNVTSEQLVLLCNEARVKPEVVQNRCYAVTGWDYEVRRICVAHRILYQGFSLLTANVDVLEQPAFQRIVRESGATAAQVIFRFALAVGIVTLTGTTDVRHMKEDLGAERIELGKADVRAIEAIAV